MHGGAKGSGAPKGNQNALKHGTYTTEALRQRAEMRLLVKETQELLRILEEAEADPASRTAASNDN
jgi:glucans biosynthesis protein